MRVLCLDRVENIVENGACLLLQTPQNESACGKGFINLAGNLSWSIKLSIVSIKILTKFGEDWIRIA